MIHLPCYAARMSITFNKRTALAAIRTLRADTARKRKTIDRCNIAAPDPSPRKRWSKSLFAMMDLGLPLPLGKLPIDVAVPAGSKRLGAEGVLNTTYCETAIPEKSFIDLGDGVCISGPELLFVEMASSLNPIERIVLGHELCGSFSRDPIDPYNGPIAYGVDPITSVERIRAFVDGSSYVHGIDQASASLPYLNDNAWSPTESLVAALLRLPSSSLGYDIGDIELNPGVRISQKLPGSKESRYPDIVVSDTSVGVNYDGLVHLDLDSIVKAALDAGAHPEARQAQTALANAVQSVRLKAVDDIRRNRELAVNGMFVLPVTKEDLYAPGGMDAIVGQLLDAIERTTNRDMGTQRSMLSKKALSRERHRAILSLLPGKSERGIQIGRFIGGHKLVDDPQTTQEYLIEL